MKNKLNQNGAKPYKNRLGRLSAKTPSMEPIQEKFSLLKGRLLHELVFAAEARVEEEYFKLAVSEASSLAWTTSYPLLVFPELLNEKATHAKVQAVKQVEILERSEIYMVNL